MQIRDAMPEESDAVRRVHVESIIELGRDGYSPEQVEAWAQRCESADYSAAIGSETQEFVVAEDDRGVVGFGSLKYESPEEYEATVDAEITAVYVHPAVAREGVGSKLYSKLECRAREQGVQTLGLSASKNAVPFYEAHGCERVREFVHEFSSDDGTGVKGAVVEMKKTL
ncbi:putative acetyltransferase [Haladaptatus litoreus]|uniref:Putative acetyltransferase n=1 Tax=Haladaptatus litoreus TaxID=553468 RepID=A0A1N7BC99_9EURY|nr:GNAT family N-acetyltransferase [Haladaptatus litoreus]SIR48886.1 putative acetyltransferase [Haladaptatus litoreus]